MILQADAIELLNALTNAGLLGAVLVGAGIAYWFTRRNNRANGELMQAFRFREEAIGDVTSNIAKVATILDNVQRRLDDGDRDHRAILEALNHQSEALARLLERRQ